MTTTIKLKLVVTNHFTRWPCTVCGGVTEKVAILCEGFDDHGEPDAASPRISFAGWFRDPADKEPDANVRVCEGCLQESDIDARLQQHANELDARAAYLRGLVGRLEVPTYADWQAADKAYDEREQLEENALMDAADKASEQHAQRDDPDPFPF